MATKIFYNENRIIIDGHADTAEECRAITAMCDSMANNENFKTIVYEEGHAVFEQVSGGESKMFQVSAMKDYVLTSRYNDETGYSAAELAAKGTIAHRLDDLEAQVAALVALIGTLPSDTDATTVVGYVGETKTLAQDGLKRATEAQLAAEAANAKASNGEQLALNAFYSANEATNKANELASIPEYKLPYTAAELVEKLG